MRAISSVASATVHVALGAAVLFGTARSGRSTPTRIPEWTIAFPEPVNTGHESGVGLPAPLAPTTPDVSTIPLPSTLLDDGVTRHPVVATYPPSTTSWASGDEAAGWLASLGETGPEVLTGPLPSYPELLRQAGVEGQVVLEALVDTTGRVEAASVALIAATHPDFVAPARQALLATLFRPARVGGRAVRRLVRVPFAFTIRRAGAGRPR